MRTYHRVISTITSTCQLGLREANHKACYTVQLHDNLRKLDPAQIVFLCDMESDPMVNRDTSRRPPLLHN